MQCVELEYVSWFWGWRTESFNMTSMDEAVVCGLHFLPGNSERPHFPAIFVSE